MPETAEPESFRLCVGHDGAGLRLDRFLAGQFEYSRSLLQEWIKTGHILVDKKQSKASLRLKATQEVLITVPPLLHAAPQPDPSIPLKVLFEDPHLLVIDKQRGLVVHPAAGNPDGTLVNALLAHGNVWSGIRGVGRPGIVHRLDKQTSGLMVVAKDDRAHLGLQQQFQDRAVVKIYQALVWGVPHPKRGRIDQPLGRDPRDRLKMAVVANGKPALSDYEVLETFADKHALVEIRLHTGRTHQIRVHLAWLGFPIVGDPVYGRFRNSYGLDGQALHCCQLGFRHPVTSEALEFHCPAPDDFQSAQASLPKG